MHHIEKLRAFVHDILPLDVIIGEEEGEDELPLDEEDLPLEEEEPEQEEDDEGPPKKKTKFPKIVFKHKGLGKKSKKWTDVKIQLARFHMQQ